jgi:hypothetical protein
MRSYKRYLLVADRLLFFFTLTSNYFYFFSQMSEVAFPKLSKPVQMKLQAAADRARAEQVAVVRCWRQSRDCLHQWTAHAAATVPAFRSLGRGYRSVVERAAEEVAAQSQACAEVARVLQEAEAARVPGAGGGQEGGAGGAGRGGAAVSVSPMEALARGSAGPAVAALVSALRVHCGSTGTLGGGAGSGAGVASMSLSLRQLGQALTAELRRELEGVLRAMEAQMAGAAEANEGFLRQTAPNPSSAAGHAEGGEQETGGESGSGSSSSTRGRRGGTTSSTGTGTSTPVGARPKVANPAWS